MQDKYVSVTQLTKYIKFKIDTDENLGQVFLRGEISNFKAHTRGHYYFTLKDENARINAVMFASSVAKCPFVPKDGMKVLVTGKVSVYEANGGYQIYVNTLEQDGIGNLYIAFEQLKEKLGKEGLFDPSRKKKIPIFPNTIGIITAPTGAAIRDILSTIKRRWPLAKTILFPSLVQGAQAAPSIVEQIKIAETYPIDVLIVGRGGGSIEDMWCFNDETVARQLASCCIPTISAVGHEIDFTIADFVCDLRAPTPTGAAEMAVPDRKDVMRLLKQMELRLHKSMSQIIKRKKDTLKEIEGRYILKNPMSIYLPFDERLDHDIERLALVMKHLIDTSHAKIDKVTSSYLFQNPNMLYQTKKDSLDYQVKLFQKEASMYLERWENRYQTALAKLDTLNPLSTIKRGYTITRMNDHVVTKRENIKEKDTLTIEFQDGKVKTSVEEIVWD